MVTESSTVTAVRRTVCVPLAPGRAFELFTSRMSAFWPPDHHIGAAEMADVVVEGRPGGRWYERGVDGSECQWGRVAVWEPPARLVLLWQINGGWRFDPEFETEVEVSFTEQEPGTTRVDLEHRGLERYGDDAQSMRAVFESPNGWGGILARYAGAAGARSQLERYAKSLDQLSRVLHRMPATVWDSWSPWSEWTARDIVGHTVWGQRLIEAWATGGEPPSYRYAPGAERPGPLAGEDPVRVWDAARTACDAVLDDNALATVVETRAAGTTTLGQFLDNLIVDNIAHAWDLATTAGVEVRLDADLVAYATRWADENEAFIRESHMFGERLVPPASADAQTALLAALGRRAW